jgi:hypothetical protein
MVATILFGAMFLTRKRNFRVLDRSSRPSILDSDTPSTEHLLSYPTDSDSELDDVSTAKNPPKIRNLGCCKVATPNTSRFRNNIHSRILQRFPFLIEMFYWIINYAFYRMTSVLSAKLFAGRGIWDVAQEHGISVLEAEEYGMLSFLFPVRERNVQQWFMQGHQDALTVLNKCYALIHIPGTVGSVFFIHGLSKLKLTFTASSAGTTMSHLPLTHLRPPVAP